MSAMWVRSTVMFAGLIGVGCGGESGEPAGGVWHADGPDDLGDFVFCIGSRHTLEFSPNELAFSFDIYVGDELLASGMHNRIKLDVVCTAPGEVEVQARVTGAGDVNATIRCIPCAPTGIAIRSDPLGDRCDSISVGAVTFSTPRNDVIGWGALPMTGGRAFAGSTSDDPAPNASGRYPLDLPLDTSGFSCGEAHESGFRTVCPDNVLEFPDGPVHVVALQLAGD